MYKGQIPVSTRKVKFRGEWKDNCKFVADHYPADWIDNKVFFACVEIYDRSGKHFEARIITTIDETLAGLFCTVFSKDLLDIMQRKNITAGGFITGRWQFCKRGKDYGLQLAETQAYT